MAWISRRTMYLPIALGPDAVKGCEADERLRSPPCLATRSVYWSTHQSPAFQLPVTDVGLPV
jgi:hypothetical protein